MATTKTGAVVTPRTIPDRRLQAPYELGSRALNPLHTRLAQGSAAIDLALDVTSTGTVGVVGHQTLTGVSGLELTLRITTVPTIPYVPVERPITEPSISLQVAFQNTPLTEDPSWTEIGTRGRSLQTQRGRSYEFDRMETGTLSSTLDNRDAALNPENASSPYAPLISTRPFRAQLIWETVYPLFRGITEGYPQEYPSLGADALVEQQVNDLFYALNRARFPPGATTLWAAVDATSTLLPVATTHPSMPQFAPFEIRVDDEVMAVVSISTGWYVVERAQNETVATAHAFGATVSTSAVKFSEELSGARIQRVLEAVGFDSDWYDLDAGQTLIADSDDLAGVSPLEHINLIVEAEFGRFFVSRAGKFTFKDRSSVILDYLDPVMTFSDGTLGQATDVPYVIEGALEHSEDKLYNRVKITTPSGFVADISDQDSIDDHFERVFEREWPYANDNDATSAAHFILMRSVEHSLRLPALSTAPARNPTVLWPIVLAREIGERCRFYYQPDAGDAIDKEVIIEGIAHDIRPGDHRMRFQLTEADPNEYWILGLTGYGELGQVTWTAF